MIARLTSGERYALLILAALAWFVVPCMGASRPGSTDLLSFEQVASERIGAVRP